MATLYKRASPQQRQILRVIEGAVRNAAHHHPEIAIPDSFARSVAKRAAGTLTALGLKELAVSRQSLDCRASVSKA